MTATNFSSSDVQTRKVWAQRVYYDSISDETLTGQLKKWGVLVMQDELTRGAGDNVKFHLLNRLSGKGLRGMASRTGNENALTYYQDQLNLDMLSEVVQIPKKGTIATQRVSFNMSEDTYRVLRNWNTERDTVAALNQLAGYYPTTLTYDGTSVTGDDRLNYLGLNAGVAPSTNNIIRAGTSNTTDEAVNADTTATMKFTLIDNAVNKAMKNRPYIEKIDSDGIDYVCFMHVDGVKQLIQDTSSPWQYRDIKLAEIASGKTDARSVGLNIQYQQTLIVGTDKIPYGVHSSTSAAQTNVRRAVFCGREALAKALGQGYSDGKETVAGYEFDSYPVEDLWMSYTLKSIKGMKKIQFNSADRGVIVISHYVA